MKKVIILLILLMFFLNILNCMSNENKVSSDVYNNSEQGGEENNVTGEDILKKRFGEFSTAGAFVLIKIQNKKTGDKAFIVPENTDWFIYILEEKEYGIKDEEDYLNFMLKEYDRYFELSDEKYKELTCSFEAKKVPEFQKIKDKGINHLLENYFEKYYWSPGGPYVYSFQDEKLEHNRDFLMILLEMGLLVRRDCESGMIYVEAME